MTMPSKRNLAVLLPQLRHAYNVLGHVLHRNRVSVPSSPANGRARDELDHALSVARSAIIYRYRRVGGRVAVRPMPCPCCNPGDDQVVEVEVLL